MFKSMKNIYLVGFMGTGKTTVGKILADKLKLKFIEMDAIIEKKEGKPVTEIFARHGEPYFRKLESDLLKEVSKKTNLVVSCGGGLICKKNNLKLLKATGTVFNLAAGAETIYARTKKYKNRPLLNTTNPLARIKELLKKRSPCYSQAHHTINTAKITPERVCDKLIKILNG